MTDQRFIVLADHGEIPCSSYEEAVSWARSLAANGQVKRPRIVVEMTYLLPTEMVVGGVDGCWDCRG